MEVSIESNLDEILFGIHYSNYEDEDGFEGKVLSIGLLIFSINFYFNP